MLEHKWHVDAPGYPLRQYLSMQTRAARAHSMCVINCASSANALGFVTLELALCLERGKYNCMQE